MRSSFALFLATVLGSVPLLQVPAGAQRPIETSDLADHPLDAAFASGGQLSLEIRSGEIHIVGSDQGKVTVHAGGSNGSDSTDIHARFESFAHSGKLTVEGGPSNNITITIEVPRNSDLKVRVTAGDVDVNGITGSKDCELHAGDLTIGVGNPADYFHVKASVMTGSIAAPAFGEQRDGLFRSFEKSGRGKYRLVAHVGAGDLTLK